MIYQFDLPWDFELFQMRVQTVMQNSVFSPWPNEHWYSEISLVKQQCGSEPVFTEQANVLMEHLTCWGLPVIKARISKTQSLGVWPAHRGWHCDEPMSEAVRIFVPVLNCDDSGIELETCPPQPTPLGFGYTWNTSKPHRIWCKPGVAMQRIAVVIVLKPNKTQSAERWAKQFQAVSRVHQYKLRLI